MRPTREAVLSARRQAHESESPRCTARAGCCSCRPYPLVWTNSAVERQRLVLVRGDLVISISSAAAAYHIFPTPWTANRIESIGIGRPTAATAKCSVDRSIPGVGDEDCSTGAEALPRHQSSGAKWAFTFTILVVVVTVTQDSVMMSRFTLHETIVRVSTATTSSGTTGKSSSVESNQVKNLLTIL